MFSLLNIMTKAQAISLFRNAAHMATELGITRSAVSQWPDEGDIPRQHELTIRYVLKLSPAAKAKLPAQKAAA